MRDEVFAVVVMMSDSMIDVTFRNHDSTIRNADQVGKKSCFERFPASIRRDMVENPPKVGYSGIVSSYNDA
jgi:hypothetical protein